MIAAVEDGASCREIVTQLSAVTDALNRAGFVLVANAMKDIGDPEGSQERDGLTTEELEKLCVALA